MICNLSDTYFTGKTNIPYQIAAASLAYVLVFIMTALSNLFGVCGSSLISRLLGLQEMEKTECVSALSFYGAIVISFLYFLGCYLFMEPLLRLLGASDSSIVFSASYAMWVVVVEGIIYIPLMFLMSVLFQLYGVVWAQFIADGLTLIISFIVYRQICRQFSE